MQGKGLIKFFFAALMLACIYQLSFSFKAGGVERKAQAAGQMAAAGIEDVEAYNDTLLRTKRDYLDSLANEDVYNLLVAKYTLEEVRARQLNLGLDLQGGMSVVLEVSKYDLIRSLSNDARNPKLIAALDAAREREGAGQGEFIGEFVKAYQEANPESQLISLFVKRDNDELSRTATNAEVETYIREAADDGIQSTYTKLRQRIDNFGVAQPSLTLEKNSGRIIVELPGVDNPAQVRKLLQATANLEFWRARDFSEIGQGLVNANNRLADMEKISGEESPATEASGEVSDTETMADEDIADADEGESAELADGDGEPDDEFSLDDLDQLEEDLLDDAAAETGAGQGPLFDIMEPTGQGAIIAFVDVTDTAQVMDYLKREEIAVEFPLTRFLWSNKPTQDSEDLFELYAVELSPDREGALLEGDIIRNARGDFDEIGRPIVNMQMKAAGAKKWKKITGANVGRYIAVVLDNAVYSAPVIQEEIPGGSTRISGNFTVDETTTLSSILETGKLPVPSKVVAEDTVGPTLGKDSIRKGIISLIIGLALVLVFMILYYSTAGIVADIALIANIFFVFGVLASLGATLTLPGMAGIVLTVGMAVDANVIIFERIREELAKGKSAMKAIADGYTHSYSAIIDANITTLIVALILSSFGMGPVKGFAVVLIIGIFSSMFTAILVSRLVIDWMGGRKLPVRYYNSITKGAFRNINYDFIGNRRKMYIVSATVVVIGIASFVINGFTLGVDFQGGRSYTVKFDQAVEAVEVRNHLQSSFDDGAVVKSFSTNNRLKITTSHRVNETAPGTDSLVTAELFGALKVFYTDQSLDVDEWNILYKESQMKVEPTIAKDIQQSSAKALIIALIAIFLYILVRFRRWQYGLGAVVALFHDTIIVLAVFSLFRNIMPFSMEISETFIAAILTVIGYSINDTVVVFDRVREYLRESKAGRFEEIVNDAIKSTLSRTLITSVTTILVLLVLFLFGSELIKGFSFAILIGVVIGTYSSVFVATPIVVDLSRKYHERAVAETPQRKKRSKKVKAS